MSPEMIRLRSLMAEYAQELRRPTRDQMETWALVEIAYQLDRIADSLANMEPRSAEMTTMIGDVHEWEHLGFPKSLPDFQRLFPDDAACATYLEGAKWPKGFACPWCHTKREPYRPLIDAAHKARIVLEDSE